MINLKFVSKREISKLSKKYQNFQKIRFSSFKIDLIFEGVIIIRNPGMPEVELGVSMRVFSKFSFKTQGEIDNFDKSISNLHQSNFLKKKKRKKKSKTWKSNITGTKIGIRDGIFRLYLETE